MGMSAPRGIFEVLDLIGPTLNLPPWLAWIEFAAIYADPSSPVGLNATHVNAFLYL